MKSKRIVLLILSALVVLSAVGVASAQQTESQRPGGHRRPHPVLNGLRAVVNAASEATGIEPRAIVEQLANGKTLAEVIAENGGSVEDVKAGLLAQVSDRLAQAVENGRITQERADEILANTSTRLDELMEHVFERLSQRQIPGGRRGTESPNQI